MAKNDLKVDDEIEFFKIFGSVVADLSEALGEDGVLKMLQVAANMKNITKNCGSEPRAKEDDERTAIAQAYVIVQFAILMDSLDPEVVKTISANRTHLKYLEKEMERMAENGGYNGQKDA